MGFRCLDLGCGKGKTREEIEKIGGEWVGLDIARSQDISIVADAHNLPFRDDTFDRVVIFKVLEHLLDPDKCLQEAKRVMRSDGYIIGTVAFLEPYHDSLYHFTHLGIEHALRAEGFTIKQLDPGWSVFEAIANWAVPIPVAKRVVIVAGRAFYRLFIWMRRKLIITYYRHSGNHRKKLSRLLREDRFRWAGELRFIAHIPTKDDS